MRLASLGTSADGGRPQGAPAAGGARSQDTRMFIAAPRRRIPGAAADDASGLTAGSAAAVGSRPATELPAAAHAPAG
jgi:hypothetical protein